MITQMQMYWLTRCDSIVETFAFLTFILCLAVIGLIIGRIACDIEDFSGNLRKTLTRLLYCCVPCLVLSLGVIIFVPSTKEMAAIIVVPAIANNEKVQDTANKLYELTVDWMEELKPSKNKTDEKQ